jgi:transcription antitermination factor NusG
VEFPLFPGYVFVRLFASNEHRAQVLRIPGVLRLVGPESGTAIPEAQIESVKALVSRNLPWTSHPFLRLGQRIRVRGGSLDGLEGIFLRRNGEDSLIISIDALQRSLSVSIKGYDIEEL